MKTKPTNLPISCPSFYYFWSFGEVIPIISLLIELVTHVTCGCRDEYILNSVVIDQMVLQINMLLLNTSTFRHVCGTSMSVEPRENNKLCFMRILIKRRNQETVVQRAAWI